MAEKLSYEQLKAMSAAEIQALGVDRWALQMKKAIQMSFTNPDERARAMANAYAQKSAAKKAGKKAKDSKLVDLPQIKYKEEWLANLTDIQRDVVKLYLRDLGHAEIARELQSKHEGLTSQGVTAIINSESVEEFMALCYKGSLNHNFWKALNTLVKAGDPNGLRIAASIPGAVTAMGKSVCRHNHDDGYCPEPLKATPKVWKLLKHLGDITSTPKIEYNVLFKVSDQPLFPTKEFDVSAESEDPKDASASDGAGSPDEILDFRMGGDNRMFK